MKATVDLFQLKILVNDNPVQEYHKSGRTFIEGRKGSNFSLKLVNLTSRRLLVHPTVDGLSAMHGKEASVEDHRGYVLGRHRVIIVPGWRVDDENVAKFYFAGGGESYAEQTGKGLDKGVIACAIWQEYTAPKKRTKGIEEEKTNYAISPENRMNPTRSYRGGGCTGQSVPCMQNLGTGFGKAAHHAVHKVEFDTATQEPAAVVTIYYDDFEGLRTRGIKISELKINNEFPNPFPKDNPDCEPPPGWRG